MGDAQKPLFQKFQIGEKQVDSAWLLPILTGVRKELVEIKPIKKSHRSETLEYSVIKG